MKINISDFIGKICTFNIFADADKIERKKGELNIAVGR